MQISPWKLKGKHAQGKSVDTYRNRIKKRRKKNKLKKKQRK